MEDLVGDPGRGLGRQGPRWAGAVALGLLAALALSAALFAIGVMGVLTRRNALIVFMSIVVTVVPAEPSISRYRSCSPSPPR